MNLIGNGGIDPTTLNITSFNALMGTVTAWAFYLAGAIALIYFMVGAIQYITAGGNAADQSKSKGVMTAAIVGIIIIALAGALTAEVQSRLHYVAPPTTTNSNSVPCVTSGTKPQTYLDSSRTLLPAVKSQISAISTSAAAHNGICATDVAFLRSVVTSLDTANATLSILHSAGSSAALVTISQNTALMASIQLLINKYPSS